MFETLKNAWKLPDLKKKDLLHFDDYRHLPFWAALPVPFLDASVMQGFGDGNLLGFLNMLTGGAFQNATLFALFDFPIHHRQHCCTAVGCCNSGSGTDGQRRR